MSRRLGIGCEQLEERIVLDGSGFAGNDCPPDLDLSAVADQTATVGQEFTLDLTAAGATIVDLVSGGGLSGDDLTFLLDPDTPSDTPTGATITDQGVFNWTPIAGQEGVHSIIVILVDQGTPALADAEVFQITVESAPNSAPVVDLNGGADGNDLTVSFVENEGPVALAADDASIVDADSANLSSAAISLSAFPDAANESLAVDTTGTAISASYDETTGVLSLTGTGTIAEYESVLRTLTYDNLSDTPDLTARQVDVVVSDGTDSSVAATATISVTATNDAPNMAEIMDVTAVVGTQIEVTVSATDAEGDALTFFLDPESAPDGTTIEQTGDTTAVVRWTPQESDGAGPHEFMVLVSDAGTPAAVDSEQFFVTVNLAAAVVDLNGAADGEDFSTTFTEDGGPVLIVDPAASITDTDDSEITGAVVTLTNIGDAGLETVAVDTTGTSIVASYESATGVLELSGTASVADYETVLRTLSYDNNSNDPELTDRVITVAVDDGSGLGDAATSTVAITAVNDAPDLVLPSPYDDPSTAVEIPNGTTVTFTAFATDADNDLSELTFSLDLDGSGIPVAAAQPTIDAATGEFTWATDMEGCFEVTVVVTDADGLADQETFLVLVSASGSVSAAQSTGVEGGQSDVTPPVVPPTQAISNSAESQTDDPTNEPVDNGLNSEDDSNPAVVDQAFATMSFEANRTDAAMLDDTMVGQNANAVSADSMPTDLTSELVSDPDEWTYSELADSSLRELDAGGEQLEESVLSAKLNTR